MIHKETTTTALVEAALKNAEDFMTAAMLATTTGRDIHKVSSALIHLRIHKAAECVEQERRLWWFLTPQYDDRLRNMPERIPETKPRKPAKRKVVNRGTKD